MIVAGLDTGTTSGAAILDGDRFIHAESFRPRGEHDPEVFAGFRIWWRAFLVAHGVEECAIEQPLRTDLVISKKVDGDPTGKTTKEPIGNMRTFLRLYGIRACAIEIAYSLNIPCREVNNKTWRSKVYGGERPPKGTANSSLWWKSHALDRCKILGWPVKGKDAAEGAMIAEWLRVVLKEEQLGIAQRNPDLFQEVA